MVFVLGGLRGEPGQIDNSILRANDGLTQGQPTLTHTSCWLNG